MTDAEWQLKERELCSLMRKTAKAGCNPKLTLAEKLPFGEKLRELREQLRQHRLNRFRDS